MSPETGDRPGRGTGDLMRSFDSRLWRQGMGKSEALHGAQLEMLRWNRVEQRGRALPWRWGAFVLSGDWR